MTIDYSDILDAQRRIEPVVKKTPILQSSRLNQWLSTKLKSNHQHSIFFKAECLQTTGAFKLRGAMNFIAKIAERGQLPKQFIANSSGNHAQAVAYAAKHFNVPAVIYGAKSMSAIKAAATQYYGATLHLFDSRVVADAAVAEASQHDQTVWIPPYNHPDVIAGQGTAAAEALQEISGVDAVFAPCGGGGLVSGSYLAAKHFSPQTKVFAAEPLAANDAAESRRKGKIVALTAPPQTLADGAATPSVGEHTFPFLQQLDDIIEVSESDIMYWTQWVNHLLKLHVEPTCCMTMQAVCEWLSTQSSPKRVLVMLSGGNISQQSMSRLWLTDHLLHTPDNKLNTLNL